MDCMDCVDSIVNLYAIYSTFICFEDVIVTVCIGESYKHEHDLVRKTSRKDLSYVGLLNQKEERVMPFTSDVYFFFSTYTIQKFSLTSSALNEHFPMYINLDGPI